jgi:hypothetical protein
MILSISSGHELFTKQVKSSDLNGKLKTWPGTMGKKISCHLKDEKHILL